MVLVNTYGVGRPTRRLVGMKRKTGFSHEVGVLLHTAATVASGGSCARCETCMFKKGKKLSSIKVVVADAHTRMHMQWTITVLLVGKDVESGEYRNAVINLDKYLSDKELPKCSYITAEAHHSISDQVDSGPCCVTRALPND
eukprot:1159561-Pelagomonas_calceolata.AAC.7